jgi:hypothetical protein
MGTLASITSVEVAGTKAKASAFNNLATEIFGVVNDGTREIYTNTFRNNRTGNSNMTFTGSDCAFFGFHEIAAGLTYDFATSTARGICFDTLVISSTGTLDLASGAAFSVI